MIQYQSVRSSDTFFVSITTFTHSKTSCFAIEKIALSMGKDSFLLYKTSCFVMLLLFLFRLGGAGLREEEREVF